MPTTAIRHGNVATPLARNIILIHSPDGTNVYGSRGGNFDRKGVCWKL